MSETTNRPTTRRAMMGNAGIAALTGVAAVMIAKPDAAAVEVLPVSRGDDAAMLTLCGRFLHLQAQIAASYGRESALFEAAEADGASHDQLVALERRGTVERNPWTNEQRRLVEDLADLSAGTLAGQRARARVLMAWCGVEGDEEGHSQMEWHELRPLFRDLLGEPV